MKAIFKSKPRTPVEILVFAYLRSEMKEAKWEEKMADLSKHIKELKSILYGNSESEPGAEACAQLTQEIFEDNTLRLLILCHPKLNLEARKDAIQVVANLQRQQVRSRYENMKVALHYGAILRECVRHQCVARYAPQKIRSCSLSSFFFVEHRY